MKTAAQKRVFPVFVFEILFMIGQEPDNWIPLTEVQQSMNWYPLSTREQFFGAVDGLINNRLISSTYARAGESPVRMVSITAAGQQILRALDVSA